MHFANVPPDEPPGKTDCCGLNVFNVYSVAVQIEIYIYSSHLASQGLTLRRVALVAKFSNVLHLSVNFYADFMVFYMYFADAPPDEPLGETDCCGFNVLMSIL